MLTVWKLVQKPYIYKSPIRQVRGIGELSREGCSGGWLEGWLISRPDKKGIMQ
jgi:hypothetical protein